MSPAFGQTEPSLVDLTIINNSLVGDDTFLGFNNLLVDGPPRVLLDRIACHLKQDCYRIISLSIGGPINYKATCVAVISTTLSRTELRRRGFEWHSSASSNEAIEGLSPSEKDALEKRVRSDTSTELVRIDFANSHWRSSYNIIRGALHHASIERAIIAIDEHIKSGCYKLEALFAVRNWCNVSIDTELTKEELRAKGFVWHGLEQNEDGTDIEDGDGVIVLPGWSREGDFWEDDDGVRHFEAIEWRVL